MAFTTLGVIILWFGWFGFNAGSTLSVDFGGVGFFAYVALNTNLAAAAGVIGAVVTSWLVIKKPDLSMMLNGAIAALVAITAACAFVAPWAAIVIGLVAGMIVVFGVLLVERLGIDDPVGALAAHGMAGVWGTLSLGFLTVPSLAEKLGTGKAGLFYGGGLHQLGIQLLGLAAVGAFTFAASFGVLWLFKVTIGIRTDEDVETAGLDVSEHGMWGYPEFYIPVPGGYGTDTHGHLGVSHAAPRHAPARTRNGGRNRARSGRLGTERTPEQELKLALLLGRQRVHVRGDNHQPVVASPDDRQRPEQVARVSQDRAARGLEPREAEPVACACGGSHPSTELGSRAAE